MYNYMYTSVLVLVTNTISGLGASLRWCQIRPGVWVRSCAGVKYDQGYGCALALASNANYITTYIYIYIYINSFLAGEDFS